jgi:hypothetical protein
VQEGTLFDFFVISHALFDAKQSLVNENRRQELIWRDMDLGAAHWLAGGPRKAVAQV